MRLVGWPGPHLAAGLRVQAFRCAALAVALGAAACGGGDLTLPGEDAPVALAIVTGGAQQGSAGAPLEEQVVVRVIDAEGRPVVGQAVLFRVVAGGGATDPEQSTTDAQGRAGTRWTLGSAAGEQRLEVRVAGDESEVGAALRDTAVATAGAGAPARLEMVSGDGQRGTAGTALAESLLVRATDAAGNPAAGVTVAWSAGGGGSVSDASTTTGPDGRTGVLRTLGTTPGTQTAQATAEGLAGSPITFTATAQAGAAGRVAIETQPSGTAQSGSAFARQPRVRLLDANGNPVEQAGIAVNASLASGPGAAALVGSTTAATDAAGLAAFSGLGISGPAGTYTIRFDGAGLAPVTSQSITLGAGAGSRLVFATPPSATARNGAPLERQPVLQLQDASGNAVRQGGVTVTVNRAAGGATLGGTTVRTTDGGGTARFTDLVLTGPTGAHTLLFAAPGYTSVTSGTITLLAGAPSATRSTLSASPTTLPRGMQSIITVTVRDASGGPVPGAGVVPASSGGDAFAPASAATDGSGVATFAMTAGAAGQRTVSATADGVAIAQTATITVEFVAARPEARADSYETDEDELLFVGSSQGVLANDRAGDGGTLSAELVADPGNGRLALFGSGAFSYTPDANYAGTDTFSYRVRERDLVSEPATVTIVVKEDGRGGGGGDDDDDDDDD
jgi:hypothetical protein